MRPEKDPFTCVSEIRKRAKAALEAKVFEQEELAQIYRRQKMQMPPQIIQLEIGGKIFNYTRPKLAKSDFDTPAYQEWLKQVIERVRASGHLLTDRQYADRKVRRKLDVGDRCRYIGPTVLEPASSGRYIQRPHGQTGAISKVMKQKNNLAVIWFRPDPPPAVQTDIVNIELVELMCREGTSKYYQLERLEA